ncbi:MAG: SusD/RagB family nutrient-binding outer membrane lipoprotein [Chitinophagaceae bacterium]|nr:SusD/RagB family nutrient-binding outer membrane lipoprotein [Chitinophagaceae bacterium]
MNKNSIHIALFVLLFAVGASCKKKLADLYNDPDQTTQPAVEKFFTEMLDNDRVRPSYWNVRTFLLMHTGIYTQSAGYLNNTSVYQQNPSYTQDYWNDFYRPGANGGGVMAHFRSIEAAYNAAKGEQQKKEMDVFLQAAKVVMLDQASQMVDLWGDIPFTEAGSISSKGEIVMAKFDGAREVYNYILDGLKTASDYFAFAQLSTVTQASFSRQDILLAGNTEQWRRYANSLRLRLLMRISFYDEARAKNEVMNILNNPTVHPLTDGSTGYLPQTTDILLQPLANYTDDLRNALTELTNHSAPGYMLNNVMKPANDPRIPVMFDKSGRTVNNVFIPNIEYRGLPVNMSAAQQQQNIGYYSILDSATFLVNSKLPGIVITAAEVNFLKAEAYERWGGGNAAAAYEMAIRQSIAFYYYLNSLNNITHVPLVPPAAADVDAFLQNPMVNYTGTAADKLEKISVQKWLHFGFLQSVQSWAEYRRTKYPRFSFSPASLPGYESPPSRLVYPASETAYNSAYALVKDKDIRTGKIFWDVK